MSAPEKEPLHGLDLLVVEDEFIVAESLTQLLESYGASSVTAHGGVQMALESLAQKSFDAAILDVHLRRENVEPVARKLMQMRTPFVFATGYGEPSMLPRSLWKVPVIHKPFEPKTLIAELTRLLPPG